MEDDKWNEMFSQYLNCRAGYTDKYTGMVQIPPSDGKLHRWAAHQRFIKRLYDEGKIKPARKSGSRDNLEVIRQRIQQLEEVEFCFEVQEESWSVLFDDLVSYAEANGNSCDVPAVYFPHPKLGRWVMSQRALLKKYAVGGQTPSDVQRERIDALNGIGFKWTIRPRKEKAAKKAAKVRRTVRRLPFKFYTVTYNQLLAHIAFFSTTMFRVRRRRSFPRPRSIRPQRRRPNRRRTRNRLPDTRSLAHTTPDYLLSASYHRHEDTRSHHARLFVVGVLPRSFISRSPLYNLIRYPMLSAFVTSILFIAVELIITRIVTAHRIV